MLQSLKEVKEMRSIDTMTNLGMTGVGWKHSVVHAQPWRLMLFHGSVSLDSKSHITSNL